MEEILVQEVSPGEFLKDGERYRLPKEQREFERIERHDESLIVQELQGKVVENELVYSFQQGSEKVVDLTWQAIFAVSSLMGGIKMGIETMNSNGPDYEVIAYAEDTFRGVRYLGAAQQPKNMPHGRPDPFALAKAVRKAQRNALKGIIPLSVVRQLIRAYLEGKEKLEIEAAKTAAFNRIETLQINKDRFLDGFTRKFGKPPEDWSLEEWKKATAFLFTPQAQKLKEAN